MKNPLLGLLIISLVDMNPPKKDVNPKTVDSVREWAEEEGIERKLIIQTPVTGYGERLLPGAVVARIDDEGIVHFYNVELGSHKMLIPASDLDKKYREWVISYPVTHR
jgi:hypothetical protein